MRAEVPPDWISGIVSGLLRKEIIPEGEEAKALRLLTLVFEAEFLKQLIEQYENAAGISGNGVTWGNRYGKLRKKFQVGSLAGILSDEDWIDGLIEFRNLIIHNNGGGRLTAVKPANMGRISTARLPSDPFAITNEHLDAVRDHLSTILPAFLVLAAKIQAAKDNYQVVGQGFSPLRS